jgi:uncharacterized membrane protein YphA (DoxX/SURF4 family)
VTRGYDETVRGADVTNRGAPALFLRNEGDTIAGRETRAMRSEKWKGLAYWISTAVLATPLLLGGVMDAVRAPDAVAFLAHLGYPAYFATIIGVWKLLGVAAILSPRLPRLKEWAYAGIVFDLSGAAISHAASGDGVGRVIVPVFLTMIALLSWALRSDDRKLTIARSERTAETLNPADAHA